MKKTVRKWWDLVEAISRLKNFQKLELYCTSMLGERTQWDFFIDLGALVRKDLLRLIKSVDIIFLPSRLEGFSYTIAESLSLGTPVLAREDWWGFADIYPDLIFFFSSSDAPENILFQLLSTYKFKTNILSTTLPAK